MMLYPNRLPADEIRLLAILPSVHFKDSVECELGQYAVAEAPPYEALSYVWGDQNDLVAATCNRHAVRITTNLHYALQRLRHPTEAMTIWADTLCMNQRDTEEKNIHVPLMGRVFSQATNTAICHGEVSREEAIAAEVNLRRLSAHYDKLTTQMDAGDIGRDLVEKLPRQPALGVSWDTVQRLFNAAWFKRVWCVQEIELARNSGDGSYVIYGHVRLPYHHIVKTTWCYHMRRAIDPAFSHGIAASKHTVISILLAVGLEPAENRILQSLDALRDHDASDPRDKVYGLLGILHEKFRLDTSAIPVNYSEPVSQVYADTATEILRLDRSLGLLDYVAYPEDYEFDSNCPSWVPRWDVKQSTEATFYEMSDFRETLPLTLSQTADVQITLKSQLIAHGLEYSHITWVSPRLIPNTRGESLRAHEMPDFQATLSDCWRRTFPGGTTCSQDRETLLSVARTFTTGCFALALSLFHGTEFTKSRFLADFLDYVHHHVGRCSPECPGIPPYRDYVVHADGERCFGSQRRFARVFDEECQRRRLFQTGHHTFGLGPDCMREGDLIVALFGGSSPYALRPTAEGFLCLGLVYIDGIMNGAYFKGLLGSGTAPRQFTLI